MRAQLEAAVEAGEVASLLVAAEWPIYGRFGYGPAPSGPSGRSTPSWSGCSATPVGSAASWSTPTALDADQADEVLARQQAADPGRIERPDCLVAHPRRRRRHARRRPDEADGSASSTTTPTGEPDGVRRLRRRRSTGTACGPDERHRGPGPGVAVDAVAERELWRYLVDVDLVAEVPWDGRPAPTRSATCSPTGAPSGRPDGGTTSGPACSTCPPRSTARVLHRRPTARARGRRPVPRPRRAVRPRRRRPTAPSCAPTDGRRRRHRSPCRALGAAWLGGTDLHAAATGAVDEHTPGAVDAPRPPCSLAPDPLVLDRLLNLTRSLAAADVGQAGVGRPRCGGGRPGAGRVAR